MPNLPLRPISFDNFIGQSKLIETLKVIIKSSKEQKKSIDHILFYGPPGLGKTTLANLIAIEMDSKLRIVQGPMLEKKSDILTIFGSINNNDIIFIDEIHGINKNIEELIYTALEEKCIDIIVGVEGDSKIVRLKLPNFTLIGATTKIGKVSSPLRDRFGIQFKLNEYSKREIYKIIENSSKLLKVEIDNEAIDILTDYSRNVPRVANNILKRIIDFKIVGNFKKIDKELVINSLEKIGLYKFGLSDHHISYLNLLLHSFSMNWVSIETMSGIMLEEKNTLENEIESSLLNLGFIIKNSRGRKITLKGKEYLKSIKLVKSY